MEAIAHQCAGDMHIAQGIVRQFRIQAPKEMRNIETALASADSDLLRRGAHTMKSMCAYMTAGVATDLCVKLQAFAKANQWSEASEAVSLLHDQISLLVRWIDNHSKAETSVAA
jgi:HPt (histidine-containing phosphotransfer) domain-containing protein